MTPYQEFMGPEITKMLEAQWARSFSEEQAITYADGMFGQQPEYSAELTRGLPAFKERFGKKSAATSPKPQ